MTARELAHYLLVAAFVALACYNAYLSYHGWSKHRLWAALFASLTAIILFVAAWRTWAYGTWYVTSKLEFLSYSFLMLRFLLLLVLAAPAAAQDTTWHVPFITAPTTWWSACSSLPARAPRTSSWISAPATAASSSPPRANTGRRGLGIELDDKLVQVSRENARRAEVAERAQFVQGDVLLTDFSRASVVTVYLLPELIGQLQTRFVEELKPGTRIVSHSFGMAGWRPDRSVTMKVTQPHAGQGDESTLYLWIVPADVRGRGRSTAGAGIDQEYQQLEVEGATGARMSGADVSWHWPQGDFRGRVQGNRIAGELGGKPVALERR